MTVVGSEQHLAPADGGEQVEALEERTVRRADARTTPRRLFLACVVLCGLYAGLAALKAPEGALAPDSGGKLATLVEADGSPLDVDVGYWAEEFDPDGRFHPLLFTRQFDAGWVQVTTLPMVMLTSPLVGWFGLSAALVIPILSAMATALAARALVDRMKGNGWFAFWAIALATPVAVFALDFWEHAPGLALMMWGVVVLFGSLHGRIDVRACLFGGALFGAAATLRSEALVYLLVVVVLIFAASGPTASRLRGRAACSLAVGVGAAGVLVANFVLERLVLGGDHRGARTLGTAVVAGRGLGVRVQDALIATLGLSGETSWAEWVFAALLVSLVGTGVVALGARDPARRRLGGLLLGIAGLLYVARFAASLGFMPGMLTASPLAVAGLVVAVKERRCRRILLLALVPLPLVWAFQYSGGVSPQWGSRYQLLSSALLACLFFCVPLRRVVTVAVVALAAVVTTAGVAMVIDRSHTVAEGMASVVARHDDAVVSLQPNLLREGGARWSRELHWLSVPDGRLGEALRITARAGDDRVAVIALEGTRLPRQLGEYRRTSTDALRVRPGEDLIVATYLAAASGP